MLEQVLGIILRLLEAQTIAVYLLPHPEASELRLAATVSSAGGVEVPGQLALSRPEIRAALNAREPIAVDLLDEDHRHSLRWTMCPISTTSSIKGLLALAAQPGRPAPEHVVRFAVQQIGLLVERMWDCLIQEAQASILQKEARFGTSLLRAATAITCRRTEEEIFDAITEALAEQGFSAVVLVPSTAPPAERTGAPVPALKILSIATPRRYLLPAMEKLGGQSIVGHTIPMAEVTRWQKRLPEGEVELIELSPGELAAYLPPSYVNLIETVSRRLNLTAVIAAPLRSGDELAAILALAGPDLSDKDLPPITSFARLASLAIENSRLHRALEATAIELQAKVVVGSAEVSRERERLLAVLESAGGGIVITDAQGIIEYANPAWEQLTGRRVSEEITQGTRIVSHDDLLSLSVGWRGSREMMGKRPDGTSYAANITVTPIFSARGKKELTGVVLVYRDITEYKEIDRIKSQFLSTASHQLRTPLTTILGFSELLVNRQNLSQEEQQRFLQHINEHAHRMKDLVEDLFEISQLESGADFSLDIKSVNLAQLLEKEIARCRHTNPDRDYRLEFDEPCPPVLADEERILRQVLHNVLSNATKYSQAGSTISVQVMPVGKYVEVTVTDQGIGMSAEELGQVFNKFWRADDSSTAVEGAGLGLVVAKHVIEQHHGQIWVESRPCKGTTVHFTLP